MKTKFMTRKALSLLLSAVMLISAFISFNAYAEETAPAAESTVEITESGGWHESAYVKWNPYPGAESYNVYVQGESGEATAIDPMLVREYKTYCRADVLGLAKGNYTLKVVPVVSGAENNDAAAQTAALSVDNYVREGFAFSDASPNKYTTGAYNEDGTLKSDAIVIYVTDANRDTVTVSGQEALGTGLNEIMSNAKKFTTPVDIRIIGKVRRPANIYVDSTMRVQDANNITIEGVGNDATLYGWGITLKRTNNIEIRNAAIMWHCNGSDGDAISMDTQNYNIFVHNMDFYYGSPGQDADQKKGDGTVDMKHQTDYVTVSYNHFYDTGKSTFSGGQWELGNKTDPTAKVNVTYHHNWFDHSDSRHPRCVVGNTHVYNNYYSGNGVGAAACENASVFVENNYFENCNMPMLIGSQGHDAYQGDGVFSGSKNLSNQDGGMIKAYGNTFVGSYDFFDQTNTPVEGQIDAYTVSAANEQIPDTVKAMKGGWAYNNFDTAATMYSYTADTPEQAKEKTIADAGRMNGGDLPWTFTDKDNNNGGIIEGLKSAIENYTSELVKAGGQNAEGVPPVETTTETTTEAQAGGELKDDKVWDISKLTVDIVDGIRFGDATGRYSSGKNTYISEDGFSYEIDGYYTGDSNPASADGAKLNGTGIPVSGSFLGVTAPDDGVITVALRTGADKISYVSDGTTALKKIDNKGNTSNSFNLVRFNVKKDIEYYVYTDGSKIRIAYVGFTAGAQAPTEPGSEETTASEPSSEGTTAGPESSSENTTEPLSESTTEPSSEGTTAGPEPSTESTTEPSSEGTTAGPEPSSESTTESSSEGTTNQEPSTESTTAGPENFGDADGDQKVEIKDVESALQYVLKGTPVNNDTKYLDVDNSGKIDSRDVAMILQHVLDSSYKLGNE